MDSSRSWATMAKRFGKCEWRRDGPLPRAHTHLTSSRQAAAGDQVHSFLPGSCASCLEEQRAHESPCSGKQPSGNCECSPLLGGPPEQKWVWVEAPPALAGVCYFPSPSLIGRCEVVLGEFLKEIKKNPSSVKFAEMANILVIHCQTTGECEGPMATAISSESERALVGV